MKINNKHVISLVLALAMVLSCMPGIALVADAAEIEKPQGISIVQNYDAYKGFHEGGWIENLGLPATVKVGNEDMPVSWGDPAEYVDPGVLGYYSIPGTVVVGEETLTTSITVQVREAVNLLKDYHGSFESGYFYDWQIYIAGTVKRVDSPVQDGTYAAKMYSTSNSSNIQIAYLRQDNTAAVGALVAEQGGGEYYYGAWGQQGAYGADSTGGALNIYLQYKTPENTDGTTVFHQYAPLVQGEWTETWGVVELPADTNDVWISMNYTSFSGGMVANDEVYLDNFQLVNIDVLPLDEEPVAITEVTDTIAPRAIVVGYNTYVGEDWQTALGLPTQVAVAASDGTTGTATVTWDYTPLGDLTTVGGYTLTGKLASDVYVNFNQLTAKQVIYVREKTNLLDNSSFEKLNGEEVVGDKTGWYFRNNPSYVTSPVKHGTYSAKTQLPSGWQAGRADFMYFADNATKAAMAQKIAATGAGQYYFGIWAQAEIDDLMAITLRISNGTTTVNSAATALTATEENDGFVEIAKTVTLSADITSLNFLLYLERLSGKTESVGGKYVYVDQAEIVPLNVVIAGEVSCDEMGHAAEAAVIENEKPATCGEDGSYDTVVYCSVCDAEISRVTTPVPATGDHTYDNDSDPDCNICDAIREVEPAQAIKYASADLDNSLDMNFYINDAVLSTVASAKIVQTKADGTTVEQVKSVEDIKVDKENDSYISYNGMAAKEMGDTITVTLYDAEENVIGVWTDSMKDYLIRIAEKNPQLQTLCTDLLHYGAAAQEEFDYNVTNLVNSDLDTPVRDVTAPGSATNPVEWTGSTLTLESSIIMEVFFAKDALTGNEIATVTYDPVNGGPVTKEIPVTLDAYYDEWSVKIEGLALADVNTVITVTIGEITVTDSMASYAGRQLAKGDIYKAILAVGESAKAYFETL